MPAKRGKCISEAEFRRMWMDGGLMVADIAAQLGVTVSAVCCRAKLRGFPPRKAIRNRVINDPEFAELYLSNVMTRDLCALYGVTHSRINRTAARLGIRIRNLRGKAGVTIETYRAAKVLIAMRASARVEQAAMINAEMVDGKAKTGRWAA